MANLKCVHCIIEFLSLPEDDEGRVSGEAALKIKEADTLVPSWEKTMVGPGQMVVACVAVPVCMGHINVKPNDAPPMVSKSGLALPFPNVS